MFLTYFDTITSTRRIKPRVWWAVVAFAGGALLGGIVERVTFGSAYVDTAANQAFAR
jgi:hypothetical protein